VGAWGPGIFSDDLACDIRGDYRELLEDGVPDDEAARRIIESYRHLDDDEEHVLWLALAASQSALGRLDAAVQSRAIDVIDNQRGLELWEEAGARELTKRKAALAKLRDQLSGPQKPRRPVRRPWRYVTDLDPGDLLAFTASNGVTAVLRVALVDDHRVNSAPILEWLEWTGSEPADARQARKLKTRNGGRGLTRGPQTFRVAKYRKKDPDWREAGFHLVDKDTTNKAGRALRAGSHCAWSGLAIILEREIAGPAK
jgi:hypothetical protein